MRKVLFFAFVLSQVLNGAVETPRYFAAHAAQAPTPVRFLYRSAEHTVVFTKSEGIFAGAAGSISLRFVSGRPGVDLSGLDAASGKVNYLIGNDRSAWRTNVPAFRGVRYRKIYRGIDSAGDLLLRLTEGTLRQPDRQHFRKVEAFPSASFAALHGGSVSMSGSMTVLVRLLSIRCCSTPPTSVAAGATGFAECPNFPPINAFELVWTGSTDAFGAKISASGNTLVYATCLGGPYCVDRGFGGGSEAFVLKVGDVISPVVLSASTLTVPPLAPELHPTFPGADHIGTTAVAVIDRIGIERFATISAVFPSQVNFVLAGRLALGPVTVRILQDAREVRGPLSKFVRIAPNRFFAAQYAGPHLTFPGLDQINVPCFRSWPEAPK